VDKLLHLPADDKIEDIRNNIHDPSEVVMFNNWLGTTNTMVALEADIMMYKSVTDIAWVPHNLYYHSRGTHSRQDTDRR
jgi:hypothetical protein